MYLLRLTGFGRAVGGSGMNPQTQTLISERVELITRRATLSFACRARTTSVLQKSDLLTDATLVGIAKTKGLDHLLAIASRARINEPVTDVAFGDRLCPADQRRARRQEIRGAGRQAQRHSARIGAFPRHGAAALRAGY